MLLRTGRLALAGALGLPACLASEKKSRPSASSSSSPGAIVGEETGAQAGQQILNDGGNAVDAVVAAALTSCVAVPSRCGVAGYGGSMTLGLEHGKKIASIDFNTMAPAAARPDMFPLDEAGKVKDRLNFYGWLAVGVPGTLAGLQLALDRFGTRSFRELVQPAIRLARDGFVVNAIFANAVRRSLGRLRNDPGSAKVYLNKNGEPFAPGDRLRNPELADLLKTLAERNSVESFYRADIAQRLADAFQKNGGLVTSKDLAAYHAREVQPYRFDWDHFDVFTAPLAAGGLTVLEALAVLKTLHWASRLPSPEQQAHARVEALRLVWKERLELLGDPEHSQVAKAAAHSLLSRQHARELADQVHQAVEAKRPVPIDIRQHTDDGTVNISCADAQGNLVALTLTQGGGFGAQVTVDGLGCTLGHGMSRFDPHPGHPNAPGPGKRPLHNMCPSVVLQHGKPLMAVGGSGGVRIPNSVFEVLLQVLARGASIEQAVAAPRLHTTGTLDVTVDAGWPKPAMDYLKQLGFKVQVGEPALVTAASFDAKTGETRRAIR